MRRHSSTKRVLAVWLALGMALAVGAVAVGRLAPSRTGTVAQGIAALLLLLASASYAARKWTYAVRLGDLYTWAVGHMVLGASCCIAVLAHAGTEEIGPQGMVLYGLTAGVSASGLWGLFERDATPRRFADHRRGQAAFPSALRRRVDMLTGGISEILARRDPTLKSWFDQRYAAALTGEEPAPEICSAYPTRYQRVAAQLHEQATEVARLRREIMRLEPLERASRRWLSLHLPLSFALLVFVAVHVAGWIYYG